MRAGGRRRGQRIESVACWTPTQSDVVRLHSLLVLVYFLRQLAEDVVNLVIDGQVAAPQLWPHLVLRGSPLLTSRLGLVTSLTSA